MFGAQLDRLDVLDVLVPVLRRTDDAEREAMSLVEGAGRSAPKASITLSANRSSVRNTAW